MDALTGVCLAEGGTRARSAQRAAQLNARSAPGYDRVIRNAGKALEAQKWFKNGGAEGVLQG